MAAVKELERAARLGRWGAATTAESERKIRI
jgi:hypothetical protein